MRNSGTVAGARLPPAQVPVPVQVPGRPHGAPSTCSSLLLSPPRSCLSSIPAASCVAVPSSIVQYSRGESGSRLLGAGQASFVYAWGISAPPRVHSLGFSASSLAVVRRFLVVELGSSPSSHSTIGRVLEHLLLLEYLEVGMAIWGEKAVPDEEQGLLQAQAETAGEVSERGPLRLAAKTVVAVFTVFLLSGCMVFLYDYSQNDSGSSALEATVGSKYPLNFLVVGDWGREGAYNQTLVAKQMGRVGHHLGIEFVISVGDNFYQAGLKSPQDPKFKNSFSKVYTARSLQTQWFAVLGNHDYLGDTLLQIGDALTLADKRWFCQRSYNLKHSLCGSSHAGRCGKFVEIFFIDTTPFVNQYWSEEEHRKFDWRGIGPRQEYLDTQLKNLSSALESSVGTWKIVVGHHAIRSLGRHGDTHELVDQVLPILEKHNVDLYINGHDHCLEHIKREDSNVHFITSGAGSKSFQGISKAKPEDGLQFGHDAQGFISVSMAAQALQIDFHDALGNNLHKLNLQK